MFFKRPFLLGMLIGFLLLIAFVYYMPDGKLHVVFCDVGQGDAVYIRTSDNRDMLIDGGPDEKVLSCLGRYMPFYDRTIDVLVLTHPEEDHLTGLVSVAQRYDVKNFVIGVIGNDSEGYRKLQRVIEERKIPIVHLYSGDSFSMGEVQSKIFWPDKTWVAQNTSPIISDSRVLKDEKVLGLSSSRKGLNDFSLYIHIIYRNFDMFFSGDADSRIQPEILKRVSLPDVDLLKYPHHGSKYGAVEEFLDELKPETAVISVGKNPWGHPTEETLKQLGDRAIKILRTDEKGDIEIVTDGKSWKY